MEEDLVQASPCVALKKPADEKPRDRVLSSDEVKAVWLALDGRRVTLRGPGNADAVAMDAIRLLFYTACRVREVLYLRWSEVDFQDAVLRLPADRMKGGRPHTVPLVTQAVAILKAIPVRSDYVFPSPTKDSAPLSVLDKPKEGVMERSGTSGWVLHDIRRTVRSGLAELGVAPHVAEAILAHAPSRLERTYNPGFLPVPRCGRPWSSGLTAWTGSPPEPRPARWWGSAGSRRSPRSPQPHPATSAPMRKMRPPRALGARPWVV
jgi:integrase